MTNRLATLREKMRNEEIDLVAIGPGAHLGWLLNVRPHGDERPLLFCVTQIGHGFLMPALEAESARKQTNFPFFEWSDAEGPEAALTHLISEIGADDARSVALDESMRADFAGLLENTLPLAKRQFSSSTIGALRMQKDADEYNALKRNAQIADEVMQAAWAAMRPGMTELEVAAIIRKHFTISGANPLFSIVGTGSNGAFPHHQTGETVLKLGDAVVMDIGAGKDGYSSDITRMALIGEAPEGYREVHEIVESAVQAALKAARPGVKAHEVDDAARGVIVNSGFGDFFVHRTGHGMGTEVHEPPYITASSQTVLEEGMVFSIEPGIYLPGRFGIRLEDIVILRSDGPEILSNMPRTEALICV